MIEELTEIIISLHYYCFFRCYLRDKCNISFLFMFRQFWIIVIFRCGLCTMKVLHIDLSFYLGSSVSDAPYFVFHLMDMYIMMCQTLVLHQHQINISYNIFSRCILYGMLQIFSFFHFLFYYILKINAHTIPVPVHKHKFTTSIVMNVGLSPNAIQRYIISKSKIMRKSNLINRLNYIHIINIK